MRLQPRPPLVTFLLVWSMFLAPVGVAWHLVLCLGCDTRHISLACVVPPHSCPVPRPVRWLLLRQSALGAAVPFPYQGLPPLDLLGGCAGRAEALREPGSWCLPLAPAMAATLGSLHVVPAPGLLCV